MEATENTEQAPQKEYQLTEDERAILVKFYQEKQLADQHFDGALQMLITSKIGVNKQGSLDATFKTLTETGA